MGVGGFIRNFQFGSEQDWRLLEGQLLAVVVFSTEKKNSRSNACIICKLPGLLVHIQDSTQNNQPIYLSNKILLS